MDDLEQAAADAALQTTLYSTIPYELMKLEPKDLKAELDIRGVNYKPGDNRSALAMLLLQNNYDIERLTATAEAARAAAVATASVQPSPPQPTQSSSQPIIGDFTTAMKSMFDQFIQLHQATNDRQIIVVNNVTDSMLQSLSCFNGYPTENATDWIKELRSLILRRKLDPDDTLINLPSRLRNNALHWHRGCGKNITKFEEYIEKFLANFTDQFDCIIWGAMLNNLKQEPNQPLHQYLVTRKIIIDRNPILPDSQKLAYLAINIRSEHEAALIGIAIAEVGATMDSVLNRAQLLDRNNKSLREVVFQQSLNAMKWLNPKKDDKKSDQRNDTNGSNRHNNANNSNFQANSNYYSNA